MKRIGPRPLGPQDGGNWLKEAASLLLRRPLWFLLAALLAPAGSALLLGLPLWDLTLPLSGSGWWTVLATGFCYGLPLTVAVCLAAGLARAANRERPPPLRQLLVMTVLKVLARASAFLLALLLQGYLAVYLIRHLISPAAILAEMGGGPRPLDFTFGVVDTLLGTQLLTLGSLLLVLQLLFAWFVPPLHLFREVPFSVAWRQSFRALQLNPWLGPVTGLTGLVLIVLASIPPLSVVAQVLALPLPAYLGAVLYVAWKDIFQGGLEDEEPVWDDAPPTPS